MTQMMAIVGTSITLMLLVGCAKIEYYQQARIGVYENELIDRWGAPTKRTTLEDNRQLLTWKYDAGCKKTAVITKTRRVEIATSSGTCPQR